ncbi:MAG: PAS domain-containing protein [Ardenticatenales bacterium]|nr:PAS domain-containing protein [Ardenticatenales bacterium]
MPALDYTVAIGTPTLFLCPHPAVIFRFGPIVMNWQTILTTLLLLLSALVSLTIAVYVWRQKQSWSPWFFGVSLSITAWAATYALELIAPTLQGKTFWAQWQYTGIASLPVNWFLFAQSYAGRTRWTSPSRFLRLFAIPLLAIVLAFTNSWHHIFWQTISLNTNGPFATFDATYGPGWFLFFIYSYVLLFLGSLGLFVALRGLAAVYRWQLAILLLSPALPWIANALYLTRLSPIPQLDLTPFAFTLSMLIFGLGITRARLFSLPPIARSLVVQNMSIAMLVVDKHNRVADVNPAAENLFGLRDKDVIGQRMGDVLGEWSSYTQPYLNKVTTEEELRIVGGESERFFTLRISPILNERGRIGGRLVLLQEITALRHAERAVALAEAKAALLAKVGHELRTPLNGVMGMAEMLEYGIYGPVSPPQQDALKKIVERTRYLTKLVNDMLEQIRLEQDDFHLEIAPFPVDQLVNRVIETTEAAAAAHKLTMVTHVEEDVPPILLGDDTRLFQVMVNLVDNAIKFTPKGKIEVQVFRADEGHWGFRVVDEGVGIPPTLHERIFEPFQQLDYNRSRNEQGMGLGLTIVRQLVTLMNGHISVDSAPRQGSIFTVTLPLLQNTEATT